MEIGLRKTGGDAFDARQKRLNWDGASSTRICSEGSRWTRAANRETLCHSILERLHSFRVLRMMDEAHARKLAEDGLALDEEVTLGPARELEHGWFFRWRIRAEPGAPKPLALLRPLLRLLLRSAPGRSKGRQKTPRIPGTPGRTRTCDPRLTRP
jgi:hypothetical protein